MGGREGGWIGGRGMVGEVDALCLYAGRITNNVTIYKRMSVSVSAHGVGNAYK